MLTRGVCPSAALPEAVHLNQNEEEREHNPGRKYKEVKGQSTAENRENSSQQMEMDSDREPAAGSQAGQGCGQDTGEVREG